MHKLLSLVFIYIYNWLAGLAGWVYYIIAVFPIDVFSICVVHLRFRTCLICYLLLIIREEIEGALQSLVTELKNVKNNALDTEHIKKQLQKKADEKDLQKCVMICISFYFFN